MKQLVILFLVCVFIGFLKADEPSDLVIVNPYGAPGGDVSIEFCIDITNIILAVMIYRQIEFEEKKLFKFLASKTFLQNDAALTIS